MQKWMKTQDIPYYYQYPCKIDAGAVEYILSSHFGNTSFYVK